MAFETSELIRCARREVEQRERVYPRLIESGKLKRTTAEREIAMMREIVRRLEASLTDNLFGGGA